MLEKEAEEKLSEEDYKLAEEVIKPIYYNSVKKDYSFARYGVDCYRAGYNKANEWHYVKDGKYPKENQLVMVYRVNPLGANIAITNWYDSYKDTKVIAWKEIVLPELKESE